MRYVIIGNSTAAVGCIEGIRQRDREGSITVIADEKHHTYSRPLIILPAVRKTTGRG
jgi:NAD(P)H-nitrite reductase large subunit